MVLTQFWQVCPVMAGTWLAPIPAWLSLGEFEYLCWHCTSLLPFECSSLIDISYMCMYMCSLLSGEYVFKQQVIEVSCNFTNHSLGWRIGFQLDENWKYVLFLCSDVWDSFLICWPRDGFNAGSHKKHLDNVEGLAPVEGIRIEQRWRWNGVVLPQYPHLVCRSFSNRCEVSFAWSSQSSVPAPIPLLANQFSFASHARVVEGVNGYIRILLSSLDIGLASCSEGLLLEVSVSMLPLV